MAAEIKRLREERNKFPARNEMDSSIKRLKYVRYADDFLIGVIGSLEDCKTVKEDIKNYLKEALKLELSDEKTLITNAQKPAKFLGFDILSVGATIYARILTANNPFARTRSGTVSELRNDAKETL